MCIYIYISLSLYMYTRNSIPAWYLHLYTVSMTITLRAHTHTSYHGISHHTTTSIAGPCQLVAVMLDSVALASPGGDGVGKDASRLAAAGDQHV